MEVKEYFRVKHSKNNFANGKIHKKNPLKLNPNL